MAVAHIATSIGSRIPSAMRYTRPADASRFLVPLTQTENADGSMALFTNLPALLNK
jgi:hypothetical protein